MKNYLKQSISNINNKERKKELKKLISNKKEIHFGNKVNRLKLKDKVQKGTATTEDKLNYRRLVKARQLNLIQKPLKAGLLGAGTAAAVATNVALPGAGMLATAAGAVAANKAANYVNKGISNTVGWNKGSSLSNNSLAKSIKKGTQLDTLQRDRLIRSEKMAKKVQERYKKKQIKLKAKELAIKNKPIKSKSKFISGLKNKLKKTK